MLYALLGDIGLEITDPRGSNLGLINNRVPPPRMVGRQLKKGVKLLNVNKCWSAEGGTQVSEIAMISGLIVDNSATIISHL